MKLEEMILYLVKNVKMAYGGVLVIINLSPSQMPPVPLAVIKATPLVIAEGKRRLINFLEDSFRWLRTEINSNINYNNPPSSERKAVQLWDVCVDQIGEEDFVILQSPDTRNRELNYTVENNKSSQPL
jgi:hypothetical protein